MKPILLALIVLSFVSPRAAASVPGVAYRNTVDAYVRFLPRFYTYYMETIFTAVDEPIARPSAPLNQIGYRRDLIGSDVLFIVRPNNDTVYGVAYLDVASEPFVFRVPDVGGRFWSVQLTDPWTEVLPGIGSHDGSPAGLYAIAGPQWQGKLPDGARLIRANAGRLCLILRVGYAGSADPASIAAAVDALHRFVGAPLSLYAKQGLPPQAPLAAEGPALPKSIRAATAELAAEDPFTLLKGIAAAAEDPTTPLTPDDRLLLGRFKADLDGAASTPAIASAMLAGLKEARRRIDARIMAAPAGDNGWVTIPAGEWGQRYLDRAAVAEYAIYANRPSDSLYPETHVDETGRRLSGDARYVLRFEKGQLPPVKDFWSVTMYREDTLTLAPNPIGRYSIGDRTPGLVYGADGSLTLYIQKDSPGADKEANWLPAPAGEFNLMLRLYGPTKPVGQYRLAPVRRG